MTGAQWVTTTHTVTTTTTTMAVPGIETPCQAAFIVPVVQAVEALTLSQAAVEEMDAALQEAKERVWAADDSLEMTQDALSRESRARRAAEGDAAAMRTERDVAVRALILTLTLTLTFHPTQTPTLTL